MIHDPLAPITPGDGWAPFEEAICRLATVPGAACVRERLAAYCILPKFRWGFAFMFAPPVSTALSLFRAILSTRCTWWCQGRWWAQRIQLHPVLGIAAHVLTRVSLSFFLTPLVFL